MTTRALTTSEHRVLLLADESMDGRAFPLKSPVRDRLLAAGLIDARGAGGRAPYYITDAGRRAVRAQGNSGGRA